MASWKKVIVSGSSAELNGLTLSGDLTVAGGDITLGSTSIFSGGDTTSLNNIDAIDATTEATIEAAIDTLANLTAASSLVTVGTLDSGAISSGFGNIDNGTSTLNTGNATVDTLTNDSAVNASHITGSFTGSFVGDGTGLTGVTAAVDIDALSAGAIDQTDNLIYSDAGTEKKITFSDFEDTIFGNFSGDATVAAGGALTLKSGVVSASAMIDHDTTTNFVANEHIDHTTVSVIAGNGLTGGGTIAADRTLNIGAGTGVTVNADDIAIGQDVATTANVTFATASITQNLTVGGDLVVNGTQTLVNTTNLLVEDRFILMNSGSAAGDGGFIVQTEAGFTGAAFGWDDSEGRFGLQIGTKLAQDATAIAPDAYASAVITSDDANYQKNGNILVSGSGDIFIYVE